MILDIDIRRCAAVMVERYRDTADFEAAVRADEYEAMGERDVQRVRLRIAQAIEELRSVNPERQRAKV
jgi:hypothetical protein